MPEYSFIACDYPCSSLIEAAHRAETDRERNLFLCFLLEYFEFVLWNHLFVSLDRGAGRLAQAAVGRQRVAQARRGHHAQRGAVLFAR